MKFEEITDWDGYVAACKEGGTCGRCKGTGIDKGYTFESYSRPDRPCYICEGTKTLPGFDPLPLAKGCFVIDKKTDQPKRWKRSAPSKMQHRKSGTDAARVYYLWRMARFHGGADVTMPMEAMTVTSGDPCVPLLDVLAESLARAIYGSDRAAAYRWGRLLKDASLPEYPPGVALSASSHMPAILEPEEDHEHLHAGEANG